MLLDRNKADSQVDEEANKASFEIIIVIIVFNLWQYFLLLRPQMDLK